MIDIDAILRAQACDNLPREVSHDAQLANRASDESEGCGEALSLDEADAGGDQADAGAVIGICSDFGCGRPVTAMTGRIWNKGTPREYALHYDCLPL